MAFKVKVKEITIKNIKNVGEGTVSFESTSDIGASIVGVYGQNGSGKTALVNAFEIIQLVLSGMPLTKQTGGYISLKTRSAQIDVSFETDSDGVRGEAIYSLTIGLDDKNTPQMNKEVLKFAHNVNAENIVAIYDCDFTEEVQVFLPVTHFNELVKSNKSLYPKFLAQKLYCKKQKQSLLFSKDFIGYLRESNDNPNYINLIESLRRFALVDLFVIKNSGDGIMNISALLPVSFIIADGDNKIHKGNVPFIINDATDIPYGFYDIIKDILGQMNIVLKRLIPDVQIAMVKLGEHLSDTGEKLFRVEYVSKKVGYDVPLRNESEGIRKIISMIGAIINFYNKSEAFTVIDEIDAGIFEYLLGELLEVLQEGGRGRMLFTSHNLRPLEKLKKDNLYFTTCNENKRFIKLKNVKPNNNLRDFYYRVVQLGGQSEELYEATNLEELSIALKRAGKYVKKQEH